MTYDRSLLSRVITWLIAGVLLILALRLALFVLGTVFGAGLALLMTVGPLILLGWLALKLWAVFTRPAP